MRERTLSSIYACVCVPSERVSEGGSLAQSRERSHHERLVLAVLDVGSEARGSVAPYDVADAVQQDILLPALLQLRHQDL